MLQAQARKALAIDATLVVIILVLIISYILPLIGCQGSTEGLANLGIGTLSQPRLNNVSNIVAYYGMCLGMGEQLICRSTIGQTAGDLVEYFNSTSRIPISDATEDLLAVSLELQSRLLVTPLPVAGISACLLVAWVVWFRYFPDHQPAWRVPLFWGLWFITVAFSLASAMCTSELIPALTFYSAVEPDSAVAVTHNEAVLTLQWLSVGLLLLLPIPLVFGQFRGLIISQTRSPMGEDMLSMSSRPSSADMMNSESGGLPGKRASPTSSRPTSIDMMDSAPGGSPRRQNSL